MHRLICWLLQQSLYPPSCKQMREHLECVRVRQPRTARSCRLRSSYRIKCTPTLLMIFVFPCVCVTRNLKRPHNGFIYLPRLYQNVLCVNRNRQVLSRHSFNFFLLCLVFNVVMHITHVWSTPIRRIRPLSHSSAPLTLAQPSIIRQHFAISSPDHSTEASTLPRPVFRIDL